MTDKEILDKVYQMLVEKECGFSSEVREIQSFIEQEWQREDERVQLAMYNRNRPVEEHALDVQEIERHRGLEIGEDGTVKGLK